MQKKSVLWPAVLLSAILSACSTVDAVNPGKTLAQASNKTMAPNSRYNFSSNIYLQLPDDAVSAVNTEARIAETAADDPDMDSAVYPDCSPGSICEEKIGQTDTPGTSKIDKLSRHFIDHTQLRINGAVDVPGKRFEIVPELYYHTRASDSSFRLPVQLDLGAGRLVADPAAFAVFADVFENKEWTRQAADGGYIVYRLPMTELKKLPTAGLLNAAFAANEAFYTQAGPSAYQILPVDTFGKKWHAQQRVRMTMDSKAYSAMLLQALKTFGDTLKKEEGRYAAEPEKQKQLAALSALFAGASEKGGLDALAEAGDYRFVCDYYLGSSNRIAAQRCVFARYLTSNPIGKAVFSDMPAGKADLVMEIGYDYSTPRFVIPRQLERVADITEGVNKDLKPLLPMLKKGMEELGSSAAAEDTDESEADDEDEAVVASAAPAPAE